MSGDTEKLAAVVTVEPDGSLAFLATEATAELQQAGSCTLTRASHVVPFNPLLWLAFVSLRRAFGETGRVADWTRAWRCLWTVDLRPSSGPLVVEPFADRAEAIAYEIDWIHSHA